jgi:hypothetical protein
MMKRKYENTSKLKLEHRSIAGKYYIFVKECHIITQGSIDSEIC